MRRAPRLRLNATNSARPAKSCWASARSPDARVNLSPRGDLKEAAANLFAMLRELDETGGAIAVSPIPETGLGEAINDRPAAAHAAPQDDTP